MNRMRRNKKSSILTTPAEHREEQQADTDTDNNKVSWWYWFEKLDGNRAKCKHCDWLKDRGPAKSTSILRCHLKTKHKELFAERMEAEAAAPVARKRAFGGGGRRKRKLNDELAATTAEQLVDDGNNNNNEDEEGQINDDIETIASISSDRSNSQLSMKHEEKELNINLAVNEELLHQNLNISTAMLSILKNTFDTKPNMDHQATGANLNMNRNATNNHQPSSAATNSNSVVRSLQTAAPPHTYLAENGATSSSSSSYLNAHHNMPPSMLPLALADGKKQQQCRQQQQQRSVVKMCREESFSAAHRLHNGQLSGRVNRELFGKCNNGNGHGHNYTWKVVLEGPVHPQTGMVYNLADLKREMAEVLELVDHKHLDMDVHYFRDNGIVSTTENLAIFLYNQLAARMSSPELLKKVCIAETNKNSFSYSGNTAE